MMILENDFLTRETFAKQQGIINADYELPEARKRVRGSFMRKLLSNPPEQPQDARKKVGGPVMKVLLINGSRRDNGCTYTALCEIAKELTAGDHDCFREKRRMESRTPAA